MNAATADERRRRTGRLHGRQRRTLSFAPGETSQTVTVLVSGDLLDEANETFIVNLSGPTNATIADGQGIGTITDDDADAEPVDQRRDRDRGQHRHDGLRLHREPVGRQRPDGHVNYATADGTATVAGSDYSRAAAR